MRFSSLIAACLFAASGFAIGQSRPPQTVEAKTGGTEPAMATARVHAHGEIKCVEASNSNRQCHIEGSFGQIYLKVGGDTADTGEAGTLTLYCDGTGSRSCKISITY